MIVQDFYISKYDWNVRIYYAIDTVFSDEIIEELINLDCSKEEFEEFYEIMKNFDYNNGFTFSNPKYKSSLLLIGVASSADEFLSTLIHEIGHLVMHIAESSGIDPFGEELQYLNGGIARAAFAVAKHFLCDNCR